MKSLERWFQSFSVARRFTPHLREDGRRLAALALLSIAVVGLELLRPWPIQWIFDNALAPVDDASELSPTVVIWTGVAAAVLIVVAKAGGQYVREIGLAKIQHGVTRTLRHELFAHLSRLSPGFHARHKSGDLLVRLMGDVPMVSAMLVSSFVEVTSRVLFVIGTITVMLVLDPLLFAVTFTLSPILVFVVRFASRQIHVAIRKQRRKEGDLADYMHEAIAATETVQSIDGAGHIVRRFARSNRRSERAGLKARRLSAGLAASVETLLGIALGTVLALGSMRVLDNHLTAGELLVFLSYVRTLSKPVRSASKHATNVAKGTACGERILAILDQEPDVVSPPDARPAPAPVEALTFDDVHFSYGEGEEALAGFDARFERGRLSALVGRSGAGKSTAASLAMRLMDPTSGKVCLNGAPLNTLELESARAAVGLCLQRTMLFGESIRENLLIGTPDASDDEIRVALAKAGALEFVDELPEGLDSKLGTSGAGLSGGQLSRLSLARTLLRDAQVLIVDEPFAGLDRLATRHVGETLKRLAADRVVVVIAHDFENIDHYDHIVFIDEGVNVDQGRHEELAERLPLYRSVVRTTAEIAG